MLNFMLRVGGGGGGFEWSGSVGLGWKAGMDEVDVDADEERKGVERELMMAVYIQNCCSMLLLLWLAS